MKREIHIYHNDPLPDEPCEELHIIADMPPPSLPDLGSPRESLAVLGTQYRLMANLIVGELMRHCPGGLVDALLVELMAARASLIRVAHDWPERSQVSHCVCPKCGWHFCEEGKDEEAKTHSAD